MRLLLSFSFSWFMKHFFVGFWLKNAFCFTERKVTHLITMHTFFHFWNEKRPQGLKFMMKVAHIFRFLLIFLDFLLRRRFISWLFQVDEIILIFSVILISVCSCSDATTMCCFDCFEKKNMYLHRFKGLRWN